MLFYVSGTKCSTCIISFDLQNSQMVVPVIIFASNLRKITKLGFQSRVCALNLYALLCEWAITRTNMTIETDHPVAQSFLNLMALGSPGALVRMQIPIQLI